MLLMRTRPEVFAEMAARGRELPSNERALKVENEEQNCLLAWNSSGTAMTATEIRERRREAYFRLKQQMDAKPNPAVDKFVDEVQRQVADAMGLTGPKAARPISFLDIAKAADAIGQAGHAPDDFSVVIPASDFCALLNDTRIFEFKISGNSAGASSMRVYGIEILRGERDIAVYCPHYMVQPNREAMTAEILRCLGRDTVRELPQSASSNGVSPRAKPVSEVGVTPRPTGSDDRNPHSLAHLSDEAKVIAAKEAIAAYARKKQLPSPAHLALFGELDGKRAGNKGASARVCAVDFAAPGSDKTIVAIRRRDGSIAVSGLPAGTLLSAVVGKDTVRISHRADDRPGQFKNWVSEHWLTIIDDIDRNDHSLASEPLSRAIDQIWVRENGGAYADLISSRSERLAEMVNRGDSAADGERG